MGKLDKSIKNAIFFIAAKEERRENSMKIEASEMQSVLKMATAKEWHNGIPEVRARVRIVVNSLLAQDRAIFTKNAEALISLLQQNRNRGIYKILLNTSSVSFAFAIYAALN